MKTRPAIIALLLCALAMSGCAAGGQIAADRPSGMTRKAYNTKLKAEGYDFWSRNDDLPMSGFFLFFEGLRQFNSGGSGT